MDQAERDLAQERSRPLRARGLKLCCPYPALMPGHVAPPAGAWIETIPPVRHRGRCAVAPPAGAWIETSTRFKQYGQRIRSRPLRARGLKLHIAAVETRAEAVAPPAGAWIETDSSHTRSRHNQSRPQRARGLKLVVLSREPRTGRPAMLGDVCQQRLAAYVPQCRGRDWQTMLCQPLPPELKRPDQKGRGRGDPPTMAGSRPIAHRGAGCCWSQSLNRSSLLYVLRRRACAGRCRNAADLLLPAHQRISSSLLPEIRR